MPWNEKDEQGQGGSIEYVFSCWSSKAGFTEYNEGKTALLILEGEAEFTNGNVIDKHLWISTPSPKSDEEGQWSVSDDGSFFVHTADSDMRFGRNSKIQKFIASALKAGVPLKQRGDSSLDARAWAGLKLRIQEKEISFDRDGEQATYQQPLVVEYLGEVETKPVLETGTTPVPKTSAKAGNGSALSSDDKTAKATLIAKKYAENEDLVSYMDDVSRTLGVGLDDEVCSQAFFEQAIKG